MNLKYFLLDYITELQYGERTSLAQAYLHVKERPRLRVPIILYLAITDEEFALSLADAEELELVRKNLATPDKLQPKYRKLIEYFNYLCTKEQREADLIARIQEAIDKLMQMKGITAQEIPLLVGTEHSLVEFTMQEYSRALLLLKKI